MPCGQAWRSADARGPTTSLSARRMCGDGSAPEANRQQMLPCEDWQLTACCLEARLADLPRSHRNCSPGRWVGSQGAIMALHWQPFVRL